MIGPVPCGWGAPPGFGASVGVVCWAVDVVLVLEVDDGVDGVVGVGTSWQLTTTVPAGMLGRVEVSQGAPSQALSEAVMADVFRISAYRAEYQREAVIVPWSDL